MPSVKAVWLLLIFSSALSAQNLFEERIRKVANFKSENFIDGGVFVGGAQGSQSTLKAMRHSFDKKLNHERVVFDFETEMAPQVYGHLNGKKNVLYIDFLKTKPGKTLNSFGVTEFIKTMNVFPFSDGTLSTELTLSENAIIEIFILDKPGRIVMDIKRKKQ
jgi:hypothetical protein